MRRWSKEFGLALWVIGTSSSIMAAGTPTPGWTEETLIKNVVKFTFGLEGYSSSSEIKESQQHFCQNVAHAVVHSDGELFAAAYPNNGTNGGDFGLDSNAVPSNFTKITNGGGYENGTENFAGNFIDVVYRSAGGTKKITRSRTYHRFARCCSLGVGNASDWGSENTNQETNDAAKCNARAVKTMVTDDASSKDHEVSLEWFDFIGEGVRRATYYPNLHLGLQVAVDDRKNAYVFYVKVGDGYKEDQENDGMGTETCDNMFEVKQAGGRMWGQKGFSVWTRISERTRGFAYQKFDRDLTRTNGALEAWGDRDHHSNHPYILLNPVKEGRPTMQSHPRSIVPRFGVGAYGNGKVVIATAIYDKPKGQDKKFITFDILPLYDGGRNYEDNGHGTGDWCSCRRAWLYYDNSTTPDSPDGKYQHIKTGSPAAGTNEDCNSEHSYRVRHHFTNIVVINDDPTVAFLESRPIINTFPESATNNLYVHSGKANSLSQVSIGTADTLRSLPAQLKKTHEVPPMALCYSTTSEHLFTATV
ncbi:MAG: hypothetical protein LBR62_02220, partial [Puniceicoccales bacterium]|nr:hypothetical protein [Puniceicoccales bacterium]